MTGRALIFVSGPGLREAVPRWLEPVLSAWPVGRLPDVRTVGSFHDIPGDAGAVLAGLGEVGTGAAREAVEAVLARHLPGVVLADPVEMHRVRTQRDGVVVEASDADPSRIAAMLYALMERQSAVRDMARDLRIAHAAQGGLCGEMDRIHEELNLAARVQRQFIPRVMPRPDGLEFASIFRPAGYVSGDIFDLRQVDEELWAFFIADVVGHGVPAALLTMVVSRAVVTREKVGKDWRAVMPCDVLARINEELCLQPEGPQRFATAVYGTVDAKTREVVMAGAGHPPPLVVDGKGGFARMEMEGPLLGVFEGAEFPQVRFALPEDRALLLYTDGFELAFPDGSAGGMKKPTTTYLGHLGQLARREGEGGTDLATSVRRLEALLDEQSGSLHRHDDVTALAIAARPRTNAGSAAISATAA
jgi:phosphoserine phosphatase RsbU/P